MPHWRNGILDRRAKYCWELYSYRAGGDTAVLECPTSSGEDPSWRSLYRCQDTEEEQVSWSWWHTCRTRWNWKRHYGQWSWRQSVTRYSKRRVAYPLDLFNGDYTPKENSLQQCQNCRTTSLIWRPSKVMLKIVLNRLQPQAEEIIAEEKWISEQEEVLLSKYSISDFWAWAKNIFSISKIFIMSSKTSKTNVNMEGSGRPWREF